VVAKTVATAMEETLSTLGIIFGCNLAKTVASTHYAYPWRDGKAELTEWLATYRGGMPSRRWSSIPLLTGFKVGV